MSFATAKTYPLQDSKGQVFHGGIVDNSEPNIIPFHNSPYARNFRVNGGGISIRKGFYNFASVTNTPFGMGVYPAFNTANDVLVVGNFVDSTHYLSTVSKTAVTTNILTGANITSTNKMQFVNANGSIYCMNGVDLLGKLNGTTYSIPTSGIANFKPSFGTFYAESLWVAGNSTDPNKIYKSDTTTIDSFTGGASDVFTASYPVFALVSNHQSLYAFSEYGIDVFNANSIRTVGSSLVYHSTPLETTEGVSNSRLVVSVGKGIYFLTPTNKIKKVVPNSFGMYDFTEISHRLANGITKTMQSLDLDQSTYWAIAVPAQQIIKFFCKTAGSTYNDICIVYHYEFDEFMVDDHKIFSCGTLMDNEIYTANPIEAKIFHDEYGQTDDDSPIPFEYDTKIFDMGEPTINKELWQARTFLGINSLASVTQEIYCNGGLVDSKVIDNTMTPISPAGIGIAPIGTLPIGTAPISDTVQNVVLVREKGDLQVRALNFQAKYKCNTLGAQLLLQRLEPRIEMKDQLTTSTY